MYRKEKVNRSYTFVMGKLWDDDSQTEHIRIDFKTAINSAIGGSSLYPDQRYLLKRGLQTPATQWLYLPALRRVRIVPYQPDDPLLQSDYLFYDLTTIHNLGDYRYRLLNSSEQAPVLEGTPLESVVGVPYETVVLHLEKRGDGYVITDLQAVSGAREKHARLSAFQEIAPGCYRPQQLTVTSLEGRTEFVFREWVLRAPNPQLLTPVQLETQTLTIPETLP